MNRTIVTSETHQIDSQLIVTLAKQALNNLPYYERSQKMFGMNSIEFRKEFKTVKIGMPRQSGHSTAALQLLFEYPDAVCFVPSGSSCQYMNTLLKNYTDDETIRRRINKNIMVPNGKAMKNLKLQKRSFIILDKSPAMSAEAIERIVSVMPASIVLELG